MQFFEATNGVIYPISRITAMRRGEWDETGFTRADGTVRFADGESSVAVLDQEIDRIMDAGNPVIPAGPGYILLVDWGSPEGGIEELPIVGWQKHHDGTLSPLVVDLTFDGLRANHGILTPHGTVHEIDGSHFPNRTAWEGYRAKQLAEKSA